MLRLRRRRRAPLPSRDEMAEGWDGPALAMPPHLIQLGAELEGMSAERGAVLAESETPNGWPIRWQRFYERPGGWKAFQAMCAEAFTNLDRQGISTAATLLACEEQRLAYGFAEKENA